MKIIFAVIFAAVCLLTIIYAEECADLPLFTAIIQGDYKQFKKLVDSGTDVNTKNGAGITALMLAAAHKKEKMVRLLLNCKADVKLKSQQGSSVLIHAGNSTGYIVRILIRAGADVNADNGFVSPLLVTAMRNRPDLMEMLLQNGANVNYENSDRESAMFYAALKGHSFCIAKLREAKADCISPMMRAVSGTETEKEMAELLQNLFDAGVSPNLQDKSGRTALMLAAKNGKTLCVKQLLTNKADRKIKDKSGKTALDYAKEGKKAECIKLLQETDSKKMNDER